MWYVFGGSEGCDMKPKAVGYVRVSTEDQAREGVSFDSQESKMRAYAEVNDLNLITIIRD